MPRNKDEVVQAQLLEQTQAATVIQTRVRGKHARRAARTKIEARSIELAAASPEKEKADVPKSDALTQAVQAEVALKTAPSTMPASSARAAAEAKKAELGAAATRAADWAAADKAVADKAVADKAAAVTSPVARPTTPVEIHQERLAEIAAKKARDRAAEDEHEAKHAFLLESELETKLAADLDELTNREQAAQHALAETESTEAAVASALGKVRLSKAEIASFDEKALSLQQVSALFAAYQTQCNSCYGALEAAEDNAKVLLAVQISTKARLAEELAESEAKLAKQSTKTRMKQTELEALADMCKVAEERPAEVLLHATSEVAMQELKLQMATLATQLRVVEHARQQESVSEMVRVLSGQQKRAEATQLIVQLIKSKLDKDAEHIGRLHEQIEALELAETHAALHATLVNAGFDTDVLAATELKAVQERALTRAAPPKLGTPGVAPEETTLNAAFQLAPEAEGGQPTRKALLAEMELVVGAQSGATARCLRDLELWQAQFQADAEAASAQRKNELIAASAEKTALEVSKAEREAYVAKKEAQLKVERAEASATAKVIHVMHGCIRMLEGEIAACNAYQSKCPSASDAAKAEEANAAGVLEALQLKYKGYQRQGHAVLEYRTCVGHDPVWHLSSNEVEDRTGEREPLREPAAARARAERRPRENAPRRRQGGAADLQSEWLVLLPLTEHSLRGPPSEARQPYRAVPSHPRRSQSMRPRAWPGPHASWRSCLRLLLLSSCQSPAGACSMPRLPLRRRCRRPSPRRPRRPRRSLADQDLRRRRRRRRRRPP